MFVNTQSRSVPCPFGLDDKLPTTLSMAQPWDRARYKWTRPKIHGVLSDNEERTDEDNDTYLLARQRIRRMLPFSTDQQIDDFLQREWTRPVHQKPWLGPFAHAQKERTRAAVAACRKQTKKFRDLPAVVCIIHASYSCMHAWFDAWFDVYLCAACFHAHV